MLQCKPSKNPCKICLKTVTQKNGLKCQGACQSWVHYSCLNYTPGKIKDIKAGAIKVTCPCPDCKSPYPKEYRTDEPFSCTNTLCPANLPPKCENTSCPINLNPPYKPLPAPLKQCSQKNCPKHGISPYTNYINPGISPRISSRTTPGTSPGMSPGMSPGTSPGTSPGMSPSTSPCFSPCKSPDISPDSSSMCCTSKGDYSGDKPRGKQSGGGGGREKVFPSVQAMEKMCNTIGNLTSQINELMCKMKQAVQEQEQKGGKGGAKGQKSDKGCALKGPKSLCPKPCYCPGNPGRKKK